MLQLSFPVNYTGFIDKLSFININVFDVSWFECVNSSNDFHQSELYLHTYAKPQPSPNSLGAWGRSPGQGQGQGRSSRR